MAGLWSLPNGASGCQGLRRDHPIRRQQVVLNVEMACSGCSGAVERVLQKMPGALQCCVSAASFLSCGVLIER